MLAEENASLILELDARPTAKQYKSLQRQMDILERRLTDAKADTQRYIFTALTLPDENDRYRFASQC